METEYSTFACDDVAMVSARCQCYDCPIAKCARQESVVRRGRTVMEKRNGTASTNETHRERMVALIEVFSEWDKLNQIRFIDLLLDYCGVSLIQYMKYETTRRLKNDAKYFDSSGDFTRMLPRSISLYIFSFLDIRTLGRCAQVCGYWKYLSECKPIWEEKCRQITIPLSNFNDSADEVGLVWKDLFQQHVIGKRARQRQNSFSIRESSSSGEVRGLGGRKPANMMLRPHNRNSERPTKIPLPRSPQRRPLVVEGWRIDDYSALVNRYNDQYDESQGNVRKPHRYAATSSGVTTNGEITQKRSQQKIPITPWRPSAAYPEDTHFGKSLGRNSQCNHRSRTPSFPRALRPSSSVHNISSTRGRPNSGYFRSTSKTRLHDEEGKWNNRNGSQHSYVDH